ncbi:SURF1 family protein [Candidatus Poriferisodalis sp.]|uniref:SURF1 family protein n=1 Tax=Candidatus Poriferisodalis sp. TaxID=3101277 RepID=UPI003B01FAA9
MYSFARRPIWLAGHALAGVLLVIFVIAGFWQLSRHNEVRDRNAVIAERQAMAALDADRFFEAVTNAGLAEGLEYRSVSLPIVGADWQESVQIRNRSLDGRAGCHIAVPMETASNGSEAPFGVLVIVGWLPQQACASLLDGDVDVFERRLPSADQITGRIRLSQERGLLGPADPAQGQLSSLARTDVERIDQQTTQDLAPVYVEITGAVDENGAAIRLGTWPGDPGDALPALEPLPPPQLDAGPHLGYTFQWFSFAAVAIVGYTLVLRHHARKGESEQIADD